MTQSKNVEPGSISFPDANGDVTIDMETVGVDVALTLPLTAASSSYSALTAGTIDMESYDPGVLWEDYLPSPWELEDMCREYPGLARSYEQFKISYNLVISDWQAKINGSK